MRAEQPQRHGHGPAEAKEQPKQKEPAVRKTLREHPYLISASIILLILAVIGTILVLGAALAFALYQLLAKNLISTLGSTLFTAIAMSSAGVASLIHYGIVSHGVGPALSWHYIMLVAGCAFFATVLPSFLINAGLGRITPQASSMISTISPLVTIIMAMIFLGEVFTFIDAIGTALIIIGVGFYAWSDARAQKAPAT